MRKELEFYLDEDRFDEDVTAVLVPEQECVGEIVAHEDCVLSGLSESKELFESQGLKVEFSRKDGEECSDGETVLRVSGVNKKLFPVVRTALNLIGRMSGVASQCRKAERIASKYGVKTAVTRKTLPGLREFDKKAAKTGGSWPHRRDLSEMVLLKKDHLSYFDSITEAVKKAKKSGLKVECEAMSLDEALDVARAGADMVMLDNFSVREADEALTALRAFPVKVEISGGIDFENLDGYAKLKPDFISMGCLTKSVNSKDFSLRIL
ncbi:carboxylating nicotinate-nucleotide diphosphorylase [archaeon]|nr:carboxylating nicotinate-nucleotide diphosphorylase [archaeon]